MESHGPAGLVWRHSVFSFLISSSGSGKILRQERLLDREIGLGNISSSLKTDGKVDNAILYISTVHIVGKLFK